MRATLPKLLRRYWPVLLVLGFILLAYLTGLLISFAEPPARPPLQHLKLTLWNQQVTEITTTLQPGVRLTNVVQLSIFDGFEPVSSLDDARRVHGEPSGLRRVPEMKLDAHIYPVAQGEVGYLQTPTELGIRCQLWAFPTNQSSEDLIIDAILSQQLLPHLSASENIRVHIREDQGHNSVTLNMTSDFITSMILGARATGK